QGWIERRWDTHVDVWSVRVVAVLRVVVGLLDVVHARSDRDGALEMDSVAGEARKARGLLEGEIHFAGGSFDLEVLDAPYEVGGEVGLLDHLEERPLRVGAGCDDLRVELLPAHQFYANRTAVLHQDASHLGIHPDLRAEEAGRAGDRLTDHPHPAADVAPRTVRAVDLTHVVVHQHVRGSGRTRPEHRADDAARAEARLDPIRFEPLVEVVGSAQR